jgi:hypothetical protein
MSRFQTGAEWMRGQVLAALLGDSPNGRDWVLGSFWDTLVREIGARVKAIAVPPAPEEQADWSPIETAPEGKWVLVCNPAAGAVPVIARKGPDGRWRCNDVPRTILDGSMAPKLWTFPPPVPTFSAPPQARAAAPNAEKQPDLPADVCELVIAARVVAFEDRSAEALKRLDKASEAFADRVPWDDEPGTEAAG